MKKRKKKEKHKILAFKWVCLELLEEAGCAVTAVLGEGVMGAS